MECWRKGYNEIMHDVKNLVPCQAHYKYFKNITCGIVSIAIIMLYDRFFSWLHQPETKIVITTKMREILL